MLVVSLTGGIASGKSTASRIFSGAPYNLALIDLDVLARQVVEPNDGSKSLTQLVKHFGNDILQEDGTLNRPALGRLTFGREREGERKVMNKIVHSAVRKRLAWLLFTYWLTGTDIVIVDTPLAVEAGLWRLCGEMVLVNCTPEQQLQRMLKRDSDKGLTQQDAENRLHSQLSLQSKLPYADIVLDNADGAKEPLDVQIKHVVEQWQKRHTHGLGRLRTWIQWLVPPVGLLMAAWAVAMRSRRVSKRLKDQKRKND